MKRRELLTSKKVPWNRHFLPQKCQTPVEFDTLDSSFVRGLHSITSSAATSNLSGTVKLKPLAVLRLIDGSRR
jgi:hypothetical protein